MTKEETRKRVLNTFKTLRKKGFLARANFMFDQSDAGYNLTLQAEKKVDQGKEIKGCVYWHNQDEENYKRYGEWYLAYGNLNSNKYGVIGMPNVEVGKIISEELESNGVNIEWNGNGGSRILIKSDGEDEF